MKYVKIQQYIHYGGTKASRLKEKNYLEDIVPTLYTIATTSEKYD